jgi:hypothetical protein
VNWAVAVGREGRSEQGRINICLGPTALVTPGTPPPHDKTSQTKVQDGGRVDNRAHTTLRKENKHKYE